MCQVSDHALLRWIERVEGIDVEAIRARIASHASLIDAAANIGCDTVKLGNGARLKLKGRVVATVLPKRGH
jgi:hypothetical protein